MVKYRTRERAKQDSKQMVIAPSEKKGFKRRGKPIPAEIQVKTGQFLCPFCLHADVITTYLISTKKGWHRTNGECPECHNGFRLESLTARMTPEQFGIWVYEYPAFRFWRKCEFEKFNRRLKQLGWSYKFWKAYKTEKQENKTQSYEEHMMEEQEEWRREQGYTDD
ncbi:MAG: hypothetical protein KKC55_15205 [Gammaproteobacteria bacterium]|nr:hypothetical protein [Gammaproteobacteria bacterium]